MCVGVHIARCTGGGDDDGAVESTHTHTQSGIRKQAEAHGLTSSACDVCAFCGASLAPMNSTDGNA